jgi:hypothetical protein
LNIGAVVLSHSISDRPNLERARSYRREWYLVGIVTLFSTLAYVDRQSLVLLVDPVKQDLHLSDTQVSLFRRRSRTYAPLVAYITFSAILLNGYGVWLPSAISRIWHLSASEIGYTLGLILLVAAPMGAWATGAVIDWIAKTGHHDSAVLVGYFASGALILPCTLGPMVARVETAWVLTTAAVLVATSSFSVYATTLARITPGRYMGKISSVCLLVTGLIGFGVGPTLIALVSDHVFTGARALGYALGVTAGICATLALLMLILTGRSLRMEKFEDV